MGETYSRTSFFGKSEAECVRAAGRGRAQGFFEALVESLPDALAVLREGQHVHCNPAYARLFGFSDPAELMGRDLLEFLPAAEVVSRLRTSGEVWSQEVEGLTRGGKPLRLELRVYPFRQGSTVYCLLVLLDLQTPGGASLALQNHERWLRELFRMSLVGMCVLDAEGRILDANETLAELAGQSLENIQGKAWRDFVPDQDPLSLVHGALRGPQETFFCHPDGRVLPVRIDAGLLPGLEGKADRVLLLVQDLRESRRAEGRLVESEDRFRHLFEEMREGYALVEVIYDEEGKPEDGRFLEVNPAWERCTGLAKAQVVGHTLREVLQAGTSEFWIEGWRRVERTGAPMRLEYYSQILDKHFSVFAQCPRKGLLSVIFLDVSDLRKQEAQKDLMLAAVEHSTVSICIMDPTGAIEYVNRRFCEVTGYAAEEMIGQHPQVLRAKGMENPPELWQAFEKGQTWVGELRSQKKDGELYWERATLAPILEGGRITHFLAVKEDITAHRALQEAQARLVEAVERAVELMIIADLRGRIVYMNQAVAVLTGLEAAAWTGRRVLDLLPRDGRDALAREILKPLREGRPWQGKLRVRRSDGALCTLAGTVSLLRPAGRDPFLTCVLRDITAEQELDRHLRQAEKMDALGALAGGVAHDFNNVLAAIMSAAELIEWQLPEESPARTKLDVIVQAVNRAKELNRRILTFSRPSEERHIPFDLTAVVHECIHLLQATAAKDVEIRSELTSSVWTMGDPVQIQQVVMNLAVNALQAMDGKGILELGLTETGTRMDFLPSGSKAAQLTVRDSGCGMDAETLEHVFEPFYTTKGSSGGTGLGLSVVHGIVTQHGGAISIDSEPGKGTLVKVLLPSAQGEATGAEEASQEVLQGTEHVLVVDLEDVRAALTKESLQHLGYRVTSKADPREALDAFRDHPAIFDAVLLEYSKGALSAEDFANRVRKLRPNTAILLVSGNVVEPGDDSLFDEVLAKPVSHRDLGLALRRALEAHRQASREEVPPPPIRDNARLGEILLVEDSPVTLSLLRTWLVKGGYRVREARDGQEAWETFTQQGPSAFSMVLSDIVMPRLDGIRLVERIREVDPVIPLVLLSSSQDVDAMKAALHLQVSEFLAKPFDSEALIACVGRLLSDVSSRQRSAETVKAVRMAQRALVAVPEKDLPLYSVYQSLTDAGGDVFRCFKQPDGSILFILADVAGHSVMSSYAVAAFLGLLSSLMDQGADLRTLVHRLNHGIQDGPFSEVPVCALLGHWQPRTGRLHVLNAGLPHGLCGGPSRRQRIAINGTPLGVFEQPVVEEKVLMLEAGERVLFASDGFFDIRSRDGELMDDIALDLWCEIHEVPIQEAVSILAGSAQTLAGDGLQDDLLAVGFEQPAPEAGALLVGLPSTATAIDEAVLKLTEYLGKVPRSIPLTHSRRFDILTAAREALTNAMIHGNRGRPESRLWLGARWEESPPSLHLEVVDEGLGFDLQALESPQDPLSERGRGIPFLRSCVSGMEMVGGELSITFDWEE